MQGSVGVLNLLAIDDATYHDAARGITVYLQNFGVDAPPEDVERVLRRYVSNGVVGGQPDYGPDSGTGKDYTIRSIAADVGLDYPFVANVLNTLSTFATYGTVDLRVAFPKKFEENQATAAQASASDTAIKHGAGTPSILEQGVYDFSNALSAGLLRGIEGAFPLVLLIGGAYFLLRDPRPQSRRY